MERRQLARLNINLRVTDIETGETWGFTENFHSEGMRLMSMKQIKINEIINILISIPNSEGSETKLAFKAQCVWVEKETNPLLHISGFKFIFPSDEIKKYIQVQLRDLPI